MSLKIDPFFFNVERDMHEICNPFLKTYGLNFFQYSKVFADGSTNFLVNNTEFIKKRTDGKRKVLSHLTGENIDKQTFVFLWNGNLPDSDTDQAREVDIDNGLCFVERHEDHYYLNAFGASREEKNTLNFYLNNLGLLKNFIQEFKDRASGLIKVADSKTIILPSEYQDVNTKKMLWKKNQGIYLKHNGIQVKLSKQEFECMKGIAKGKTIRDTAFDLDLSPRTVESYLIRLKNKTGVNSKSELIQLYQSTFGI